MIARSSGDRAMGPSLSIDRHKAIAPNRDTRPQVGRRPYTPQLTHGETMLPSVSEPIANPTSPAATAAPGPALEPPEPSLVFHGFRVMPPNQTSPIASSPSESFATSTAPASCSFRTTVASASKV